MESYSSDSSDSDNPAPCKILDYSYLMLDSSTVKHNLEQFLETQKKSAVNIESLLLYHNQLSLVPNNLTKFTNLRTLDLSANRLSYVSEILLECPNLTSLILKNNSLEDDALPKTFGEMASLKELNLSGNNFTNFPEQILDLSNLKYLYFGGNRLSDIPKDIWKLARLQVLYLGGNELTEVPVAVGRLKNLQALVLCENNLEGLPSSIANLKHLKSLLLHKNQLTTLPPEIVTLKDLTELSLRDNPLVSRFVRDLTYSTPSLLEMAGRVIKMHEIKYSPVDLPHNLVDYLDNAHQCVNPKCNGVFFDNRVEHIKFVDFCGKYRIPLLQYLCSSKCIRPSNHVDSESDEEHDRLKKVLLG